MRPTYADFTLSLLFRTSPGIIVFTFRRGAISAWDSPHAVRIMRVFSNRVSQRTLLGLGEWRVFIYNNFPTQLARNKFTDYNDGRKKILRTGSPSATVAPWKPHSQTAQPSTFEQVGLQVPVATKLVKV